MKYGLILFLVILIGCSKNNNQINSNDSYLPMQVGNYWRNNDDNYIQIVGTQKIGENLFYKFVSRTGGDVYGENYYRIDADNNLIEQFPNDPSSVFIHAKFDINVGDGFYSNDGSNGYYIIYTTMVKKENGLVTFGSRLTNHPNLKETSYKSYKKGLGFADNWKEVKIGDKVYKF